MESHTIISASELATKLADPNLVLLDCSLEATATGKRSPFSGMTIPGARFLDLKKDFSDTTAPFPNTIPTVTDFQENARQLGVNSDSKIVVFDAMGIYSSPRVWWLFKVMGHYNIQVLDGGIPAWNELGLALTESYASDYTYGNFQAELDTKQVKTFEDLEANVDTPAFTVVDARSAGRFEGVEPEPRAYLQSGSIPHSVNMPFQEVLDNGKFKSKDELHQLFDERSLLDKNLVYSCGSGLTACIIMLAGEIAAQKNKQVYDGSWTEWAELKNLKKEN